MKNKDNNSFVFLENEFNEGEHSSDFIKKKKRKKIKNKIKKTGIEKASNFLFILGLVSIVISILPLAGIVISLLYILILVLIGILSLLTLFLNENYMNQINNSQKITEFMAGLTVYIPSALFISALFIGLSLLLTFISKNKSKNKALIIFKFVLLTVVLTIGIFLRTKYF